MQWQPTFSFYPTLRLDSFLGSGIQLGVGKLQTAYLMLTRRLAARFQGDKAEGRQWIGLINGHLWTSLIL